MARQKRLKLKDEEGFFHIMSRISNKLPDPVFASRKKIKFKLNKFINGLNKSKLGLI